jgi:hypothetical protein
MTTRAQGKIVHSNSLIGQQGINLIATIVAEMGHLWTPTTGHSDAGIDGYIEIRRTDTSEATNFILQVQSKATAREWENEADETFDFRCDERDLAYWLQGNAPVILVVSRPKTNEAYWISIKEYFRDLETRKSRKVHFNKKTNRFIAAAAPALMVRAMPRDAGVYLAPPPKQETLYSNLLPLGRYAPNFFMAETTHRKPREIWTIFKELDIRPGGEWFLKEGKFVSFHDLTQEPWSQLCDQGTVESFQTDEWALAADQEKKNDFVRLLGLALRNLLGSRGVWYVEPRNGIGFYYFAPTRDLSPRVVQWKRIKQSERTVFQAYPSKKDPTRIAYYRHLAFEPWFRRFGGTWFLEITPTYHFTSDGKIASRYRESCLSGIKRIEKHVAVAGNVFFWAHFLTERDLFSKTSPFITFAELLEFPVEFGIRDEDWVAKAEEDEKQLLQEAETAELPLVYES